MSKVEAQLIENLKLAGISYYNNKGECKQPAEILDEISKVADSLPPRLLASIIINMSGRLVTDDMGSKELANLTFGTNLK